MSGRLALFAATSLIATLASCNWGVRPKDFPPATSPAGARVALRVRDESTDRIGELYAVDSAGVVIRSARLTRVHWSRLAAMDVQALRSDYDISFGEVPDASKRERLALISRFPQGLSDELLQRVLARLRQPSLDEVR